MCLFKKVSRRIGASFAAFLMVCCLTAPALAANDWPSSPSFFDFYSHPNCWYVWKRTVLRGVGGFELICSPMNEFESSNTVSLSFPFSYSTNSSTYSYTSSSGVTRTFMYSTPFIPASMSAIWSNLPSFPVGVPSNLTAAVRLYPYIRSGYLANISDVFTDRSIFAFLTSWPASGDSSIADTFDHEVFDTYPVYVPSNIFFFGDKTDSSTNHSSFGIVDGDNDFWATPFNSNYLDLSKSHYSTTGFHSFPSNFSIPSSDVGFVFCRDAGTGYNPYNSVFNVSDLQFVATLWVPDSLLPSNVAIGDWISKADVESLQDQLVKDFDINSDTLKDSKANFDSWQNSNTIDTDVANTSLDIINGLMQNVGQFAFVVSLLCFGAVVLRVLIRKAVEG